MLIVDESHVSIPQVRAMYNGDRARKLNLVEHGFRLPSALDNRPMKFAEFVEKIDKTIYVSAPPAEYELDLSEGNIVEQIIRPTGYYSLKANRIKKTSKRIVKVFDSKVPNNMEDLLTLDGVGRKTANIVLSVAYNKTDGIALDTHVKRLSNRLGLTNNSNPEKIEIDLMNDLKKENWDRFSILLILHGRKVCQARKPDCNNCLLSDLCPYYESIKK